jgi:hypothetical protein
MTESLNVPGFNLGNDFAAYDSHISSGVLRRSPASPDSTYHLRFLDGDWPSISVEPRSFFVNIRMAPRVPNRRSLQSCELALELARR